MVPGPLPVPAGTEAERILVDIWQKLLRIDRFGIHDNFFEVGGDSILVMQAAAQARKAGLPLVPRDFLRHQTVAALAAAGDRAAVVAEQGEVQGRVPLIPIQRWWADLELPNPHHFNQAVLFELNEPVEVWLEPALDAVLRHHDAFRLRFRKAAGGWEQSYAPAHQAVPVVERNLTGLERATQRMIVERESVAAQGSLDLGVGPVARAILFRLGGGEPSRLLLVIHHLVVDGVSWRVLMADLQEALVRRRASEPIVLPPKTSSFKAWAERLEAYAQSPELSREVDDWIAHLGDSVTPLPRDHERGPNLEGSAGVLYVSLTAAETTALLREAAPAYGTGMNEVLLTALVDALHQWTGERSFLIDFDGHGREDLFDDIDLSRTVGWMTTLAPVRLELPRSRELGAVVNRVAEQLAAFPNNRLGYGLLRDLCRDPAVHERMHALPRAEVSFNNLGQLDQALDETFFRQAPEHEGPWRCPTNPRPHTLGLDGHILNGALRVRWDYSENLHRRATIEQVSRSFLVSLRRLIETAPSKASRTPRAADYRPDEQGVGGSHGDL